MAGRSRAGESAISDLTSERLERALRGSFGRLHRIVATTGSTNTDALAWAAAGAPEGAVVVAERQTAGRGRGGRTWVSAGGDLLFSVILRPARAPSTLGLLTAAVGVALAEAVEATTSLSCGLKWPNDVVVGARKLAGILVETRVERRTATVAVCGVGLNVATRPRDLPPELAPHATSLASLGATVERARLLAEVLVRLEELYPRVCDPARTEAVARLAAARSVVLGRALAVRSHDGRVLVGKATALLPSGALQIDGKAVSSGTVEWIEPA